MTESNRNYIAVGTFVVTMLILLIAWFAALSGMLKPTDEYFIVWDNVMGLKSGTQILNDGYQVGLIEGIQKNEAGKNYRVNIAVKKDWPIPDSAVAETASATVLAAMVINIKSGNSKTMLEPGSEIPGKEQGDLLSAAGEVLATVTDTLKFIKPRLEEIATSVNSILSKDNANQVATMITTLNKRIEEILSTENAARIENILMNLSQVSEDVSELTAGLRNTQQQIEDMFSQLNTLVENHSDDVAHGLVDMHATLETVARHIDSVANNLESTTRNMNEFSGQIRTNPSVLLRGRSMPDDVAESK